MLTNILGKTVLFSILFEMSFQLIILGFSTGRARSMDPFKRHKKPSRKANWPFCRWMSTSPASNKYGKLWRGRHSSSRIPNSCFQWQGSSQSIPGIDYLWLCLPGMQYFARLSSQGIFCRVVALLKSPLHFSWLTPHEGKGNFKKLSWSQNDW